MLDLLTLTVGPKFSHVTRQQQLSIDICCGSAPDFSSKPAGRRCSLHVAYVVSVPLLASQCQCQ